MINILVIGDDTAFYISGNDANKISKEMTSAANKFNGWCTMNRLTFNLEKSKALIFSNSKGRNNSKFKDKIEEWIGDYVMEIVNEYR